MTDETSDRFVADSTQEALERAFAETAAEPQEAVEPQAAEQEAEAPAEQEAPQGGPARGPDGKFAPKAAEAQAEKAPEAAAQPEEEAPASFHAQAKADWKSVPPSVRGEFQRRMGEMERGLQQYQATVTQIKPLLDHYGGPQQVLEYVQNMGRFEAALQQNPADGFARICQAMQIDPRAVAAQIMGQPEPQRDQVIEGLRAELAGIKQQVGTVHQTFEQQRQQQTVQTVQQFAAANPRFDELSGEIAQMLKTGYATDLADAYAKAERLNPAPVAAPAPQTSAPAADQPRKSQLSVHGSPGSNPAGTRTVAKSSDEALRLAATRLGIGI